MEGRADTIDRLYGCGDLQQPIADVRDDPHDDEHGE